MEAGERKHNHGARNQRKSRHARDKAWTVSVPIASRLQVWHVFCHVHGFPALSEHDKLATAAQNTANRHNTATARIGI
jgi:hypothetical protein